MGSLRVVAVAAALGLGGCELLSVFDDDASASANSGVDALAKAPLPPPPAPRLSRLASRRPAVDRGGAADASAPGDAITGEPIVAAAPARAVEREVPVEPPPADAVAPERVVGLTENALAAWLGDPAHRREESPARVWRYEGAGCALDVFFYLDLVSRQFRALSYEIRNSTSDDQRCLSPVFAGRGDPSRTAARRVD
ncbi:MAG: hypothetical protein JNK67_23235 [Alphaproteobacteria bacterium]|nr:hypothetical protein [Alphaproteobacteria bacterium]